MDEPRVPTDGDASDVVALARVVARLRARVEELEERLATAVLRERAQGALMAGEGLSALAAGAALARRAEERGRTVAEECWAVLDAARRRTAPAAPLPAVPVAARTAGPDADGVRAVFDGLTGPALLLTPLRSPVSGEVEDYRIDAAAPGTPGPVGRRGGGLVGRRLLEAYPAVAGTEPWRGLAGTLATGVPYESGPPPRGRVAGASPWESRTVRAARLGGRLVVSWTRHDASGSGACRRMERLAGLGRMEWDVRTGGAAWSEQAYRVFGRDPAEAPPDWEGLASCVVPEDAQRLAAAARRLLREGLPLDGTFRVMTPSGVRHLRLVAEVATGAEGTAVEVHALCQDLTALRRTEQALAESEREVLAQQDLLAAERELASRLQDALLPRQDGPLAVAGLRAEASYLPAQTGLSVGGDWYSAVGLPDGDGLFAIGDVAGHGIDAVATMAQLRFTAKGMVVTGSPLPDALARLNALLLHAPEGRHPTATLVLARYRPQDRTMTWVQAGHLPPLLVRGGRAGYLARPAGIVLGAGPDASYEERRLAVLPGDHLLLYTDGLVERPGEDLAAGLDRLARLAAVAVRGAAGAERLTVRLADALSPVRRDDVCLLHLTLPDDGV
ncbi:PP2C family protein-serine/threonine phosphatase [Streptomyces somaliensis]|uniref:SpoIIE family protein phosphatase n=1 Tax=Streptomyces somaliensis (strain ATCC 33201 / DSM 40738 / JCM 12659 / KCTC 9044 / NCTC 11332 / NRRL B-12077 / IP 733) TaxID=1134445 RepID=A0AA44DFS2_STRE0|nr:SpoIIE family protein phosphatase [Streptomyces somaliensis]NKY15992.1 SpoIIE family protein phosphatase [Streptomyces somaliensis DSM 40738]